MIAFLVCHLIESTLFALLVAVITFVLRQRSAATRHLLWLAAAAKFILPAAVFSVLGVSLSQLVPVRLISASVPLVVLRRAVAPTALMPLAGPKSGISDVLIAMWLIGIVVAFSMWLPKLWASLNRPRYAEDPEQPLLLRLRKQIGLRREVTSQRSSSVSEPVLLGFWKPVVLFPDGLLENLSSAELESILLHELAHAKRRDNWTAAFAHVVTCIFWFYPLLWWIEKRMHSERELACDEMVIHCGSAPKDYVAAILKVCRFRLGTEIAGVSGVCDSNLKSRMEVIMSLSPNTRLLQSPRVLLGSLCAVAILLPLALGFLTASNTYGQATKAQNNQPASANQISCAFASGLYPEGTVIQEGNGPEQMCVRVLNPPLRVGSATGSYAPVTYRTQWVRTSEAARERAATVVHLPERPVVSCTPAPSVRENICACKEGGDFSQNSLVNSAVGAFELRCGRGKWVQTSTPNLVRK